MMSSSSFCRYSCRLLFVILFLSIAISVVCSEIWATTLAHMSVAQMSQTAPVIVRVRCEENTARWDAGEIWTFTRFAVADIWKGSVPREITVRLLGGTVGNLNSTVAGIPRFQPGETVILFLEPTSHGDLSVLSWQQGTFRLRTDARSLQEIVTQDTASFATFDAAARRFEVSGVRNIPMDAFRQQVRAALSSAPAKRQP
jgi:hypothetical protein